ncbi:Melibiose/raffinose/stachyose import permease protein MelD [subsurface metagenome]
MISKSRDNLYGFIFILPAVLVLGCFFAYPILKTLYLSTAEWNMLSKPEWVGFENYIALFQDGDFYKSLWVTIYYVFGTTLLNIPLAFLCAVALNGAGKAQGFFKGIYFIPVVLSTVIASVLWISVYHPYSGIMQLLPLPAQLKVQSWYQRPDLVVPGLIVFTLWKGIGLYIVIFLAALINIPASYQEAAQIDGASFWQSLFKIVIPMLKPIFLFTVVICVVYSFQNFAIVYTSTKGGPNDYSKILPILIFENGFKYYKMGYASALAVIQFLLMFFFSYIQFKVFKSEVE